MEAIEGPLTAGGCLLDSGICLGEGCLFGELLDSLDNRFREHLTTTRLSQLADTMGVIRA